MSSPLITIITPTTGKDGLFRLMDSIESQNVPYVHILMWDEFREGKFLFPYMDTMKLLKPTDLDASSQLGIRYSIVIPGKMVQGLASGSALRSVAMMAAYTPYVTFADDDVWYEQGHFAGLLKAIKDRDWAYCKRRVWASETDYIGIDDFESVGDRPTRRVPYEMVDNNSMLFTRRLGTSAAVLYRETSEYNDDRLMYAFLKKYGGIPGKVDNATVNQICPKKLEAMFRELCTKS